MFCEINISTNEALDLHKCTHAEAAAAVATVYSEPANDVTCPAPLVASVIAWPPLEVITVANDPPIAKGTSDQIKLGYKLLLTSYSLEDISCIASSLTKSRASLRFIYISTD